jgi:hypothetical protein
MPCWLPTGYHTAHLKFAWIQHSQMDSTFTYRRSKHKVLKMNAYFISERIFMQLGIDWMSTMKGAELI